MCLNFLRTKLKVDERRNGIPVIKSPSDNRNYRALVLENKLKVLLISDPNCDKAIGCISVAVGSMNDPINLQGLAHLCEHMLFYENLDTKNSPGVKSFSKLISEYGGMCNAFTTRDLTNYHFDVSPGALREALQRFSSFFTNPLPPFPENALKKEINVIHSEFQNKLNNDFWRKAAVDAWSTRNSDNDENHHPFSQFSTGNRETLDRIPQENSINVRDALVEFHKKYYSANLMFLVVLGKENLDELESFVRPSFSKIPNLKIEMQSWETNPFSLNQLRCRVDILPIGDVRDLYVTFPIPDTRPLFRSYPQGYLTYLIGHKGPGSLWSLLKHRNWVNNIFVSTQIPARGFAVFSIGLQLTDEGLENINEIIGHTFQYLKMLRNCGAQEYFWREMKDILSIHFQFLDKDSSPEFVQRVANVMQVYPLENVLSEGYILYEFNPSTISDLLGRLIPHNCRISTVHKGNKLKANLTEQWYSVKYGVSKISDDLIQDWSCTNTLHEFQLPAKNEFIPYKFELKTRDRETGLVPMLIVDSPITRAWFLQDNEFRIPKAVVKLEICSPLPLMDPRRFNLNHLMGTVIKDILTEELYSANLTGIVYTIKGTMYGLEISVDGFDHKLTLVMETIVKEIISFKIDPLRLKVLKETYIAGLRSWANQAPNLQIHYHLSLLLRRVRFSNSELLQNLEDIDEINLREYFQDFLKNLKLEWFVYGNMTESESIDLVLRFQEYFTKLGTQPLKPSEAVRQQEICLPPGSNFVVKLQPKSHPSSCTAVLFQLGQQSIRDNVLAELVEQIILESCFSILRAKEELGYIVKTSIRRSHGTLGFLIVVQGNRHPVYVESRIDSFLIHFGILLMRMSEGLFNQHKRGLVARKQEKPKIMTSRGNNIWDKEIYTRQYNFDRLNLELRELETITLQHTIDYFNEHIGPTGTNKKRLSVHMIATENIAEIAQNDFSRRQKNIETIEKWKQGLSFYPPSEESQISDTNYKYPITA